MPTTTSQQDATPRGGQAATGRRHVGLTLPRQVKHGMLEAADVLAWSAGDWVLAAAAEHGPALRARLTTPVRRRASVVESTFAALYLTPDEREELDEQAASCRLNRSAFVTAVVRLSLGDDLEEVVTALTAPA